MARRLLAVTYPPATPGGALRLRHLPCLTCGLLASTGCPQRRHLIGEPEDVLPPLVLGRGVQSAPTDTRSRRQEQVMSEQSTEQQPEGTESTAQDGGTTVNVTGAEPDVNVHGSGPSDADASDSAEGEQGGAQDGGSAE